MINDPLCTRALKNKIREKKKYIFLIFSVIYFRRKVGGLWFYLHIVATITRCILIGWQPCGLSPLSERPMVDVRICIPYWFTATSSRSNLFLMVSIVILLFISIKEVVLNAGFFMNRYIGVLKRDTSMRFLDVGFLA